MGHEVGATASRMQDALDNARSCQCDFAIIDVNLDGRPTCLVADILSEHTPSFSERATVERGSIGNVRMHGS
ncbi:hypothetical protein IE4872_PC00400 (plasmid) [Rhizobium gallicum]|uniref:Uncharacterized protein n=1 Tax=Rhizobium gallicum TaxID=56730 RepID=A0A1L5NRA1_9HYPH|nr:hypothetical protein IE4872_PC00400 [Rhizobium gallicum]